MLTATSCAVRWSLLRIAGVDAPDVTRMPAVAFGKPTPLNADRSVVIAAFGRV